MAQFTGSLDISGSLFVNGSEVTPGGGGGSSVNQIIAGSGIDVSPTQGTGSVTISATGGGITTTPFWLDATPDYTYMTSSAIHVSESGKFILIRDIIGSPTQAYDITWYPELFSNPRDITYIGFYTTAGTGTAFTVNTRVSCSANYQWYWPGNGITFTTGSFTRISGLERYNNALAGGIQGAYMGNNGVWYSTNASYIMNYQISKRQGPLNF